MSVTRQGRVRQQRTNDNLPQVPEVINRLVSLRGAVCHEKKKFFLGVMVKTKLFFSRGRENKRGSKNPKPLSYSSYIFSGPPE